MDDYPGNGTTTDVPPAPRQYFDGNETRYQQAEQKATEGEDTILRWMKYLQWLVWLLLAMCVVLLGVVLSLAARSQVTVEFIVQNEHQQLRILGWDEYAPEEGVMKRDLEGWLRCARGIPTDRGTFLQCWRRVPMFIRKQSQCAQAVETYQQQRQPGRQLFHKSVVVEDLQGSREPDGRWRFSWAEKTYQLDHGHTGTLLDTSTWHAILIVQRRPPTTPEEIKDGSETVNPLGLLCTELAWWK